MRPEHIQQYRGHSIVIHNDKGQRTFHWGNKQTDKLRDMKDFIDSQFREQTRH